MNTRALSFGPRLGNVNAPAPVDNRSPLAPLLDPIFRALGVEGAAMLGLGVLVGGAVLLGRWSKGGRK